MLPARVFYTCDRGCNKSFCQFERKCSNSADVERVVSSTHEQIWQVVSSNWFSLIHAPH